MVLVERLKHGGAGLVDIHRFEIGIQILLRLVMQPNELFLFAFLQEAQPRALPLQAVIASFELQHALTRAKVQTQRSVADVR